ncbi:MAG: lipid II flippase MurJ, partial [Acidobacteriota bacterium]|nr:lipid II flippase MurJ [Acidobacteriota bacterium]
MTRSAGVVSLATLLSRVLGLVRDLALAFHFGANNAMDAFSVAFRIPNLTRDLFDEGAMSSAFVPTLTRRLTTDGRDAAWELGQQLITALVAVTVGLVLLAMAFATPMTVLMAGEFGGVPGKLELTVLLTRVMLPFLPLVATAAICMGMLNSMRRLFVPAVSPAVYNVSL